MSSRPSSRPSSRATGRDERGLVLPTRLMVLSISFVAIAGLAFVAWQPDEPGQTASPAASTPTEQPESSPTGGPTSIPPMPTMGNPETPKPKPQVRRAEVNVEVYNNSNVTGLAARVAAQASSIGWQVVGADNWYGTVDSSTVYYAPKLKAAAALLAKDLGIDRVKPAIAPMRFDRLTVILTADFA